MRNFISKLLFTLDGHLLFDLTRPEMINDDGIMIPSTTSFYCVSSRVFRLVIPEFLQGNKCFVCDMDKRKHI